MLQKIMGLLMVVLIVATTVGMPVKAVALAEVTLGPLTDRNRGDMVELVGDTNLKELNVKVVNSEGSLIYIDTLTPEMDGTYRHTFKLSATEVYGETTVVIGEGAVIAVQSFRIVAASPGPGGPTGPGNPPIEPPATPQEPVSEKLDVLFNGKSEPLGELTRTTVDGREVSTVTLDAEQLSQRLASSKRAEIRVGLPKHNDTVVTRLTGSMISEMEKQQAVLIIETERGSYRLPAGELNIEAISSQLGSAVPLADITIDVQLSTPSQAVLDTVLAAALKGNVTLIASPLAFTITASAGGQTMEIDSFNSYVARMIKINDGVSYDQITTAVVVEPDGTLRHVPTTVVVVEGKYYAQVQSLTNSVYGVIWNPMEFRDMDTHWAKDYVNDMGARLIVNGKNNGQFRPNLSMTRAEFATTLVRALGLKLVKKETAFHDVARQAWYYDEVNTAHAYSLMSGGGDDAFRPSALINREEAIAVLARAASLAGLSNTLGDAGADHVLVGFRDANAVSPWAKESVAQALQTGIVRGITSDTLAPKALATRAELAVMIYRLLHSSNLI